MGQKSSQVRLLHAFFLSGLVAVGCVLWFCHDLVLASTPEKITSHPAIDYFPAPSQDGRYLAFVSERAGNADIWLKSLSARAISLPRQLTTHPAVDGNPSLNADGSQLLYVSNKTDPRGDIYLLDVVTGEEKRLTDLSSGDSLPQWSLQKDVIFYLKQDLVSEKRGVFRRSLLDGAEQEVVTHASTFSITQDGWIVYAHEGNLYALPGAESEDRVELMVGTDLDVSPVMTDTGMLVFARYQEDTNEDGVVNTDDQSSIWTGQMNQATHQLDSLYQLTPANHFHLYPVETQGVVYFSDLRNGDIFRLTLKRFLNGYASFDQAHEQATWHFDRDETDLGILGLTNISRNLAPDLLVTQRAEFDFAYVEQLVEAGHFTLAQQVLEPYAGENGRIGALARLQTIVLNLRQHVGQLSQAGLTRLIQKHVADLLVIGENHRSDDMVYGQALIEVGRLHLLGGDFLSALDYLAKVDGLENKDVRAKALFTRGIGYRALGDESSLLQVFVDVITLFGENSSWGRRAVTQAIAVSERGTDVHQQTASLQTLVDAYSSLPLLIASARLRMAELYEKNGEQLKAIAVLDQVLTMPLPFPEMVERAYTQKAEILSAAERYEEAADVYAALVEHTGTNQLELDRVKRLMVLQLVRKAIKNRAIGEVRIAAKELLAITQTYPESVEAHREYINTKVMLKEIPAVQAVYRKQVEANPEHAVYRYSLGLALSYSNPPDFFSVISLIEQAIGLDPGIPYFYQTLGWAYEQVEQIDGKYGYLEKAEQAYRIALDLNDEFQFPIVESNLLLNLGNTYMALANYPEAYRHYRQRDQSHSITRDPTTELLFRKNFGEACFKTGHSEESIGQYRLALKRVPDDQPILRAELLERLGLSQQDLGRYSEAVQSYSQAMEINLELGNRKNLALLQRNIGVNLYNLGSSGNQTEREALKNALKSYFASLDSIQQFGGKQKQKGSGFFNVEVPLGGGGSEAASGFDAIGEEKLMFSYIAGTYEKLKEPAPAREYYLKKLALIAASPDADTNVARLTEKAVVLNRIGLLSHQLELPVEAIDYMRQSLGYTQTLDLNFGTRINVYNLSRLFAEQFLTGEEIEWDIVAVLVEALDEQIAEEQKDPQTFYALTNVAFLLSALSDSFAHSSDNIEDAVEHLHMLYTLKTHAWSYYVKARAMLEDHTIFPDGPNASLLLMLDLNMRDIALAGNNQEASARLQKNLNGLAEMVGVWNSWLWSVLQAEHAEKPDERQVWLRQAFDELMRYPPQALPRQHISAVMPFLDRLSALYVDGLVEDGRYEQAFIIAEQLAMRKMSLMLYEVMGEEFFLTGVGEYAEDLGSLIKEIRHGLSQGQPEQLEALSAELEEVLFALYEEYPWAVSYFWQYPLTAETLSVAVNAEHRYMKVVPGIEQSHGFIHHGTHVQYFPIEGNVTQVQEILRQPGLGYLSTAESLLTQAQAFFPNTIPVTRVSNSYEIINGFHQRSLFYTNVTVASKRSALLMPTAGAVSFSLQTLNGDPVSDSKLIEMTDVFVTMNRQKDLAFTVNEQLRVREFIRVRNLAGSTHHTAIILNSTKEHEASTALLVNALIRSGFPHVIVGHGRYDKETAEQFVGQYLARLTDMPPHEAVAQASAKVQDVSAVASSFVLYGYAGMNEEEKMAFASAIYADQLNTAVSLYQEGQYPQALQHMIHALSVIHYADKMEDFRELTKLVVDAAYKIGEYQTAVFHQNQLLQALGETATSEERSEAFYQLGILYSRLEQFDVAIQHLESANVLWLQAEELDRLAEGIATLGVVRENMGAYSEALLDFGRSYALYEEIGEVGDVATQHRRIGRIYYLRLGRYEEARKNFSVALESYRELEDRRGEAETLYEIGLTYEKIGLFEQADQYYQQGRQIGKELDDPFLIASGYLYLANTSWFRGSYQEAFQFLSRADTLARDAGDTQLTIMVHNTRGLMYWTLNDSEKALLSLHEAVTMAQEADIKTELASSLNNVGLVYRQQGDYVTALEYFEQAKHIDEVLNSRWGLGYDYRNIGISQLKMGKVVEAEENFIQAEQTSAAIKNAINWVKALLELGNVNRTLKKSEKAIGYYTQAYERAKRYGIKEVEWRAAKGKGGILWEQGNHVDAFSWYANAVTVVEGMRASLKIDELRNSFQVNKQDLYRETVRLLIEMDRIDEAFNYLERSRSRSFIDLLGNQKLTLNNEADQQALDTISVMSRRVEALKTEVGSYEEPPADVVARYRDAKTRYDQMVLELKQQNPGLSSFVSVDPLTLQDVQQMIAPDVGLLSYMVSTQGSYVWLIQESGVTFYPIPANEEAIAKIIGRYRQAVQQVESVDDELQALYAYLIAPVRQDLEDIKYLGIIPDGPLHFLSFAALKHAEEYLVDRYPIFYTPAASVLKFTFAQRRTEKATKVLAVGNPDLGNYNYDLPLAELEAQSIKWNYPDMDILTGAKATKEWFVEHIKDYGVIHLAAHGEFDEFNPLFSSLWLASNAPTNRRLTVKEVFGLEINADLVTLSACQTGLGKLEAGELIGLNRAFIYAGTHALVSALWRVDDLSTSVLMKHFYRNYVTMDKAKSLRQAQLLVKRDFPHPSYWAGFSLVGDYQ